MQADGFFLITGRYFLLTLRRILSYKTRSDRATSSETTAGRCCSDCSHVAHHTGVDARSWPNRGQIGVAFHKS